MNVKEFYLQTGGNYEEVLGRLIKEERIVKYLRKFADGNDCKLICEAFENRDYEAAFRNVHNLKGVALNLGLTNLQLAASDLCEEVRNGAPNKDVSGMIENVVKVYTSDVEAIGRID